MQYVTALELADKASQLCLDKRAQDVIIMDLRGLTSITDCFVICSADSDVQVKAITEHVCGEFEKYKIKPWHVEGNNTLNWVLLDFVEIVVHIFQPETRVFYGLERLWGDAKIKEVKDEAKRTPTTNS